MPNSKVDEQVDNLSSPLDTDAEIHSRILNTQTGIVDTVEELDAQIHNLGPADTAIEAENLDEEGPSPHRPK